MVPIILVALGLVGLVLCIQFGMRYVFQYELGDVALKVQLFGAIPVYQVRYDRISRVEFKKFTETLAPNFTTFRFGNRIFGDAVLVHKTSGIVGELLITPDDPQGFLKELAIRANDAYRK